MEVYSYVFWLNCSNEIVRGWSIGLDFLDGRGIKIDWNIVGYLWVWMGVIEEL